MADLTNGTMTSLDVQNFQNYIITLPEVVEVDAYIPGALGYGDVGWGSNQPFYSTGTDIWLLQLS
jgi:hypothetical protein